MARVQIKTNANHEGGFETSSIQIDESTQLFAGETIDLPQVQADELVAAAPNVVEIVPEPEAPAEEPSEDA